MADPPTTTPPALNPMNLADIPEPTLASFLSPRLHRPLAEEEEMARAAGCNVRCVFLSAFGLVFLLFEAFNRPPLFPCCCSHQAENNNEPLALSGNVLVRPSNWKRTHWANRSAAAETIKKLLAESNANENAGASTSTIDNQHPPTEPSVEVKLQTSAESGAWKRTHWADEEAAAKAIKKLLAESNSGTEDHNSDDNAAMTLVDCGATEGWRHRHWGDKEAAIEAISKLMAETNNNINWHIVDIRGLFYSVYIFNLDLDLGYLTFLCFNSYRCTGFKTGQPRWCGG